MKSFSWAKLETETMVKLITNLRGFRQLDVPNFTDPPWLQGILGLLGGTCGVIGCFCAWVLGWKSWLGQVDWDSLRTVGWAGASGFR
jgi:hypothetical protein